MQGSFLPAFWSGPDPRVMAEVTERELQNAALFCPSEPPPGSGSPVGLASPVGSVQTGGRLPCAARPNVLERARGGGRQRGPRWPRHPRAGTSTRLWKEPEPGARRPFLEEAPDPSNSVSLCSRLRGLTA